MIHPAAFSSRQPPVPPPARSLPDILQEIAGRSPKDLLALTVLAQMVLERLKAAAS